MTRNVDVGVWSRRVDSLSVGEVLSTYLGAFFFMFVLIVGGLL